MPLLIGGSGEKVMLGLVARYADEWNCWGTPEIVRRKIAVLTEHCAVIGRDPAEIHKSVQALLFMEGEGDPPGARLTTMAERILVGSPATLAGWRGRDGRRRVDELIVPDSTLGDHENRLRL